MHAIENEIIKLTGYKAQRKFSDRQDYLKSILNAVGKLADDDFDSLSDEAAEWANAAVEAHNSKKGEIPDFDELSEADPDPEDDEAEAEDEDEAEAEEADEDSDDEDPDDQGDEDEPDDEDDADPEQLELPVDQPDPEDEDEPDLKPAKKAAKAPAKKAAKAAPAKEKAKPKVAEKLVSKLKRGSDEEVDLDKWGSMVGSKNSQALAMFEKGATTKEIKDTLGGTYYNILKKMVEAGHKLDKEGSLIKLTHKDNVGKKASAVKKKK